MATSQELVEAALGVAPDLPSEAEWRAHASCRTWPPGWWLDPVTHVEVGRAKALCQSCPSRCPCLLQALEQGEVGIWGGLTEEERSALRKRPSGCPCCQSQRILSQGARQECLDCRARWSD